MWALGYLVVSSGNVPGDVIMEFIANQDQQERAPNDDFNINTLSRLEGGTGMNPPPSGR